jgi:MoxR-like ATPase
MTQNTDRLVFTGKKILSASPGAHKDSPETAEPYVVNDRLKMAVNLAITLRRPLLLEGDPGCGKTCLARAVAFELGLPYFRWNIQSTTKAKDGQYTYDALGRLHDVQVRKGEQITLRDPSNIGDYLKAGALGNAFIIKDRTSIVLIDEIDKADIDFPNDLLTVLDRPWKFQVTETGREVQAHEDHVPIVIITSNKEKGNLPEAFLRRCLYHYVDFPNSPEELKQIVDRHYQIGNETPAVSIPSGDLQSAAIDRFLEVRNREGGLVKKPGTSEFLDWLKALQIFGETPYDPVKLKQEQDRLPYPELLLKVQKDWRQFTPVV